MKNEQGSSIVNPSTEYAMKKMSSKIRRGIWVGRITKIATTYLKQAFFPCLVSLSRVIWKFMRLV